MSRLFASEIRAALLALATVAVAAIVALAGCGGGAQTVRNPRPAKPQEYRIGVEDLIEVSVWKERDLSTTTPVRPDGRITVPLVGEIKAAGRTAHELEREISAKLGERISAPVVSVGVKEVAARVFVLGEVARPGVYPLRGSLNLIEALALAGGLTEFADEDDIVVLRRAAKDGERKRISVSYGKAVGGGELFDLQPGDTIVVR
jgi:polysaccharide biosynthesis/export protein